MTIFLNYTRKNADENKTRLSTANNLQKQDLRFQKMRLSDLITALAFFSLYDLLYTRKNFLKTILNNLTFT